MRLMPVPTLSGLASENVTIAEALKTAGYVTGIFGKWHLDQRKPGVAPARQGFDTVFESEHGWKKNEQEQRSRQRQAHTKALARMTQARV